LCTKPHCGLNKETPEETQEEEILEETQEEETPEETQEEEEAETHHLQEDNPQDNKQPPPFTENDSWVPLPSILKETAPEPRNS
jgi:hypothetical protein